MTYVGRHAQRNRSDSVILGMVFVLLACLALIVWGIHTENNNCSKSGGVVHLGWCSTATGAQYDPEP